jgi:hypothetical protein
MWGFVAARIAMGPKARTESSIAAAAVSFIRRTGSSKCIAVNSRTSYTPRPRVAFFALKGSRCTPSLNCDVADHKHNRSLNNQ